MLSRQICCVMRNSCSLAQGVTLHDDVSLLQDPAGEVLDFEAALGK